MKVSGNIIIKGMQLPESLPVKVEDIVIEYHAEFAPSEVKDMINLVDLLPGKIDVLAACAKKFMQYQEEFTSGETQDTEVQDILHAMKQAESEEE